MRTATILIAGLAALATATPAPAQTVTGRLLDAVTREPIESGTLSLLSDDSTVAFVVTDAGGAFTLSVPEGGSYQLRAERIGYRTAVTPPLDLLAGDTLSIEYRLSVDAVALNPITVIAFSRHPAGPLGGFYDRQRRNLAGHFVTRAQIDERNPVFTTDLLQGIAGVNVVHTARAGGAVVLLRGNCRPQVYLDGVPIGLAGMSIDDLVQPMDLEGIEVYRGPGEVPVEFARGACGAVLLWTRRG